MRLASSDISNPSVLDTSSLISGFTEGSVIFVDSTTTLAEDNTNFFWDDTSNFLKISELRLDGDNQNITLGEGQDANISYTGTLFSIDVTPSFFYMTPTGEMSFGAGNGVYDFAVGSGSTHLKLYDSSFNLVSIQVVSDKLRISKDVHLLDNIKSFYGTGSDASIYYDGTNLVYDAAEAGSGHHYFIEPVGIGETDPNNSSAANCKLWVKNVDVGGAPTFTIADVAIFEHSGLGGAAVQILTSSARTGALAFSDESARSVGSVVYDHGSDDMYFVTGSGERLRIKSNGDIYQNADSDKFFFGAEQDASITYDGTDLIIDPDEVGSGAVSIAGEFKVLSDHSGFGIAPQTDSYLEIGPSITDTSTKLLLNISGDFGPSTASGIYAGIQNVATTSGTANFMFANGARFNFLHGSTGTCTNLVGQQSFAGSTGSAGNVTSAFAVEGKVLASAASSTFTNGYSFKATAPLITGAITTYAGLWVDNTSGATNNYGVVVDSDSIGLHLGGGQDASIIYDATDLSIDSSVVGSGTIRLNSSNNWTANGSGTVTISNLAPAGVGTATIGKWLTVKDNAGTVYYIPAWT